MAEIIAGLFILLLFLVWVLNLFSLPANWINIFLLLIFKIVYSEMGVEWSFFLILLLLAGLAEIIELFSQIWGSKRYGGSSKGSWGAFLGALVGAILGAPVLMGLGALPGALAGSFLGSLLLEIAGKRPLPEALQASKGAFFGKTLGFVAKLGLGMAMLALAIPKVWP